MMEELKSFYDLAEKVEPWNPSKEFMEESIRQSKKMAAEAFISARDIVIF